MDDLTIAGKTTRSILVIEQEYQLRVALLNALSEQNWKVQFALTEESIESSVKSVAGVIFSWDLPPTVSRERILELIGDLPHVVAHKPYDVQEVVNKTQSQITKDQFFVGDQVVSRTTPEFGNGKVVSIYPDHFYGVIFNAEGNQNSPEIAIRCHFTGLRLIRS